MLLRHGLKSCMVCIDSERLQMTALIVDLRVSVGNLATRMTSMETRMNVSILSLRDSIDALATNSLTASSPVRSLAIVAPVKVRPGLMNPPPVTYRTWNPDVTFGNVTPAVGSSPQDICIDFPATASGFVTLTHHQICDICHFYCFSFGISADDSRTVRQTKLQAAFCQ